MFGKVTYMIWLGLFIGLPLLLIAWRWPRLLWQQRRALALTTLGALVGGWAWDALAVRFGIWFYDPATILNLWYFGLPLEEWLWIVGVTMMFGSLTAVMMERQP